MASAALLVVITVALLSVLALALVVLRLVRQVSDLARRIRAVQERLGPPLEELARETEIASLKLEELADAAQGDGEAGGGLPRRTDPRGPDPYTGRGGRGGEPGAPRRRNEGSRWD
jgi:hypothetical protein